VIVRFAAVVLALAAALLPLPPEAVEQWYSTGVYPPLQSVVTALSNRVPFALFDALIVGGLVAWLTAFAFDVVRRHHLGWLRVAARVVVRTAVWAAVLYLLFLAVWGLNYRRVPLTRKLDFDRSRVTPGAARALLAATVDRLNALHDPAHKAGWPPALAIDPDLARGFEEAAAKVGVRTRVELGRPKTTILDWYFRKAGVEGMTDPYFLETLVNDELLPFERPLVVAHEWAHLAGFSDEGEANFVGYLACLDSPPPDQYSGWLFLYSEVARVLPPAERNPVTASLGEGPRSDLQAIQARLQRQLSPRISTAGWRAYDRYLRANRVEAGAESYDQVVTLVLGTRFK
jgi:Protein of unknown function (DUF3810)